MEEIIIIGLSDVTGEMLTLTLTEDLSEFTASLMTPWTQLPLQTRSNAATEKLITYIKSVQINEI